MLYSPSLSCTELYGERMEEKGRCEEGGEGPLLDGGLYG